jgi:hypothetical protein
MLVLENLKCSTIRLTEQNIAGIEVFPGIERQCTDDEHDDEDGSRSSESGFKCCRQNA